ncbi:MAG: hypothetical protein JW881_03485 [Spirochaetales bacterium]|nr:hypothetical protein [Spirochaetales bacterium]
MKKMHATVCAMVLVVTASGCITTKTTKVTEYDIRFEKQLTVAVIEVKIKQSTGKDGFRIRPRIFSSPK